MQDGKYTIEQELGEGGFGITYRARDNNGRYVVIKTLNDRVQRRPDFAKFQQDFLNEALRLARCSHPQIVQVDEVIQEGQLWCIVMQYIDGENLGTRIENQGALSEAEALRYIQQIGEALTVVHNNGLLHRDVKPQNIMLRGKSEAVLIDFGIAREFTPNLTQTHTQMLSDGFAPIEQYDKRTKRGAYTDVYALAATLYYVLTVEVPTIAPLRAIGTLLEPPKQINPSISDKVNQAILRGMEIKPEDRPQSMQEWLTLLQTNNDACTALPQMLGTWYGKFGSGKATLVITKQSGDSFDGTLIHEQWWNGTAKVVINGSLNPKRNVVIIREISIISGYWRLGENQGTLSFDGKQISGKGKDRSKSYSWSLVRVD